ncbi:unnamed protein product [Heterosigma akashiwo]
MMAGFGAPKKKEDVKVGTGGKALKKQAATFAELVKAGSRPFEVFVREAGTPQWNLAGEVGCPGRAAAAAPARTSSGGSRRRRPPAVPGAAEAEGPAAGGWPAPAGGRRGGGGAPRGRRARRPLRLSARGPPRGRLQRAGEKTSSNIMGGQEIQLADSRGASSSNI